ncbi:energy transducer TonB [Sandarakinorhabdus oryzae]|uniref:energy transducer TonB n=1 Tax=Sandarakinorhabdus oryzae TaxID=2675220 RepID=UPI0018CC73A7|nr:energy transducer TonB [Sandarakinorhabdus oryzae]
MLQRLALLLALILSAAPAVATTVQEDFNTAQAHLDALRLADARNGFTALLNRIGLQSRSRSAMIVRARLAETMVGQGDAEEAVPLLETALTGFAAGVAADADERAGALSHLAHAEEEMGKLRAAYRHWQAVIDEKLLPETSVGMLQARLGAARTGQWTQPEQALAAVDRLLALPDSGWGDTPKAAKTGQVLALRLKAQIAMRQGKLEAAKVALAQAGKLAGGTETQRVDLGDVQLRGDLALLAWLRGSETELMQYTALSGATMLDDGTRAGGRGNELPSCAPQGNLAPDAMAVVEFSVRDDGRVLNVRPIYANPGSGAADSHPEEEFAAAVHNWSWPADQATAVNPLWRAAIRVELRCLSTQPDVIWASLQRDLLAWYQARGLAWPEATGTDAERRIQLLAQLAAVDARNGPQSLAALPILVALVTNSAVGPSETAPMAERLAALATAQDAPTMVLFLAWQAGKTRDATAPAITRADQRGEARFADYLRLEQLEQRKTPNAEAVLQAIIARHPASDPLHTRALIQLSDLAFARGAEADAAALLARTGLSPQQCALVDVKPQGKNALFSDADFPTAARIWSLSGLMRIAHDIKPSGEASNVRVVMARPPFIFSAAAVKRVTAWRFQPVLRGDASVGCVNRNFPTRFRMIN